MLGGNEQITITTSRKIPIPIFLGIWNEEKSRNVSFQLKRVHFGLWFVFAWIYFGWVFKSHLNYYTMYCLRIGFHLSYFLKLPPYGFGTLFSLRKRNHQKFKNARPMGWVGLFSIKGNSYKRKLKRALKMKIAFFNEAGRLILKNSPNVLEW